MLLYDFGIFDYFTVDHSCNYWLYSKQKRILNKLKTKIKPPIYDYSKLFLQVKLEWTDPLSYPHILTHYYKTTLLKISFEKELYCITSSPSQHLSILYLMFLLYSVIFSFSLSSCYTKNSSSSSPKRLPGSDSSCV